MTRVQHAFAAAPLFTCLLLGSAQAALTISSKPTQNVTCNAGACTATADNAVLNVAELGAMLAAMPVSVQSTGLAGDIVVAAPLGWSSSNALTLDAYHALTIDRPISVRGTSALVLTVNDGGIGGDLSFGAKGHVRFWDLASTLSINGEAYTLVANVHGLAAAIAAHPNNNFALAADYDAVNDGQYSHAPIPTTLKGTFEGLGNTIANLSIYDVVDSLVAPFAALGGQGVLRDIGMVNVSVLSEYNYFQIIGGLVAYNGGTIIQSYATGSVRSDFWTVGGGIAGESYGPITRSYADVIVSGATNAEVGGLVGNNHGHLTDSYAIGHTIAGDQSSVGGLIGYDLGHVEGVYATGKVSGGQGAYVGGLLGKSAPKISHAYWDIETSETTNGVANGNQDKVIGLTTAQLQAGLPKGFDPAVWGQNAKINAGLPYLLTMPPK